MRNISEMAKYFSTFTDKSINNIKKAQQQTGEVIRDDAKQLAPFETGVYEESITMSPLELQKGEISTKIYTTEQVVTKDGKSYNLGFLLENGTYHHAIPNAFGWGDKYGYDSERYYRTLDPNWHPGTIAQPHFTTALQQNETTYLQNIDKAIKEAGK